MIENGILKPSGTIQLRGGTYTALTSENPLLARREIMIEIDTGRLKVGDGVNRYNARPYSGGLDVPASDNKVYVMKNGQWVQATLVEQPSSWEPAIDDTQDIVLTVDNDMNVFQLTGNNIEVNT